MESPASFLHATNEYLLIITVNGRCSVWNVLQGAAVLRRVPMDHLCYQNKGAALEQESIEGESALLSCLITPKGMPAIITSALHAYLYDNELGAWILVAREDDPITSSSDFYNSFPPLRSSEEAAGQYATFDLITNALKRFSWNSYLSRRHEHHLLQVDQKHQLLATRFHLEVFSPPHCEYCLALLTFSATRRNKLSCAGAMGL
jgi:hypothetical protein